MPPRPPDDVASGSNAPRPVFVAKLPPLRDGSPAPNAPGPFVSVAPIGIGPPELPGPGCPLAEQPPVTIDEKAEAGPPTPLTVATTLLDGAGTEAVQSPRASVVYALAAVAPLE